MQNFDKKVLENKIKERRLLFYNQDFEFSV
ncbi:hypothetical protein ZORO111903_14980 [Zobellia roscoffensis]